MSNALSSSTTKQGTQRVFCSVDDGDIFPPALRILLNSYNPKFIQKIQIDYDATDCEKAAVAHMKDEDAGVKINLEKVTTVTEPEGKNCYKLPSTRKGAGLLGRDVGLSAGVLRVTGPNVDITKREEPNEGTKHQGVHTVHRLYMAAAFRVLLGGTNVGNNTGVAALVVSPDGQILCWGKKNSEHPMLHAETSALLAYGQTLPAGARIYSTLKPCKMCRAFIQHFSNDGDFVVYYGQDDPTMAALGSGKDSKYVFLSNPVKGVRPESPIWAKNDAEDKKRPDELRDTVAGQLSTQYSGRHHTDKSLGIIDFIKGGKANANLTKAANYLQIKQRKYADQKLEAIHNQNVKKCLAHITSVLQQLNLPLPVTL